MPGRREHPACQRMRDPDGPGQSVFCEIHAPALYAGRWVAESVAVVIAVPVAPDMAEAVGGSAASGRFDRERQVGWRAAAVVLNPDKDVSAGQH